jgi:hypothetical protein
VAAMVAFVIVLVLVAAFLIVQYWVPRHPR